jgi:glutamate 5-kinase
MSIYQLLLNAVKDNDVNMKVSQTLLTKEHFGAPEHLERMLGVIAQMSDVLPIINENDSVAIRELFTDNDELAGYLAKLIHADHLIILSGIDGIYDCDPNKYTHAKPIRHIDASDERACSINTDGISNKGRGGMVTKLRSVLDAALSGIAVHVASSRVPNVISRLVKGELDFGTRIDTTATSGRRLFGGPSFERAVRAPSF